LPQIQSLSPPAIRIQLTNDFPPGHAQRARSIRPHSREHPSPSFRGFAQVAGIVFTRTNKKGTFYLRKPLLPWMKTQKS
jgi:hypothetical protein